MTDSESRFTPHPFDSAQGKLYILSHKGREKLDISDDRLASNLIVYDPSLKPDLADKIPDLNVLRMVQI